MSFFQSCLKCNREKEDFKMYFVPQTRPKLIISVAPKSAPAQVKIDMNSLTETQAKRYILEMDKSGMM